MTFWGNKPDECDFAFNSVVATMRDVKEYLIIDIYTALSQKFKEQAMVAHLVCLRVLGERYPNELGVVFDRNDLEFVKTSFDQWCKLA